MRSYNVEYKKLNKVDRKVVNEKRKRIEREFQTEEKRNYKQAELF